MWLRQYGRERVAFRQQQWREFDALGHADRRYLARAQHRRARAATSVYTCTQLHMYRVLYPRIPTAAANGNAPLAWPLGVPRRKKNAIHRPSNHHSCTRIRIRSESELHRNAPVYPGHCYNFTNWACSWVTGVIYDGRGRQEESKRTCPDFAGCMNILSLFAGRLPQTVVVFQAVLNACRAVRNGHEKWLPRVVGSHTGSHNPCCVNRGSEGVSVSGPRLDGKAQNELVLYFACSDTV